MSTHHWERVNELFHAAREHDEKSRDAFLRTACGSDESLRREVESLLASYFKAGDFLQAPLVKDAIGYLSHPEDLLSAGDRIGAYSIVREIGRGGIGAVYLAERSDQQFQKYVAVKLIKPGMDTGHVLRHFHMERQILATFDHPNIARLLDGGSTEKGLPYFVMEYVEGRPIDVYCDARRLTINRRLDLFQKVCAAVSYAHRNLVVHRDIKPSNILVTSDDTPKLLDFGIARILQPDAAEGEGLTATGIRMMTPEFASPEQALGNPVTTLSDVYSLGVLLYILLTGRAPYRIQGHSPLEIAQTITETQPQLPSQAIRRAEAGSPTDPESISQTREGNPDRLSRRLRGDLDNIVLTALRKEPQRRYQSVDQFSEDIRRHLEGLTVHARKDTLMYRVGKFAQRNKAAVAIAVLAFFAVAAAAIIAGIIQWRANQQAQYLQEFGQEAARMEGIMRFAYMLPFHNASYEREIVRNHIAAIQTRMNELGSNAQGPGHYAIGRGLMALHQYREARKHFELSLNQYKYRVPEVCYAYGLTLAMLYQEELEAAGRITSDELRKKRLEEVKKEFKDPALFYIAQGERSSEYSEYAAAIVQFLDGNYDEAIRKSQEAIRQIPWLYEAMRLQAESYRSQGRRLVDQGKHSDALSAFTNAEKQFEASIQKGASDSLGYEGVCSLYPDIVWLQFLSGGAAETAYEKGNGYCKKAMQADPDNVDAYIQTALLYMQYERYGESSGKGANRGLVEQAIQAAQKAVLLRPDDPKTSVALGNAYRRLASYLYETGGDPSKAAHASEDSFTKAIRLNPNDSGTYYSLGQLLWSYGQYLTDSGSDSRPVLDRAAQALQTSIRLNPDDYRPYHMMGNVLFAKGDYEAGAGLDPTPSIRGAEEALQKALKINPGLLPGYYSLAFAEGIEARYCILMGRDPAEATAKEKAAYQQSLQLNPKSSFSYEGLAEAALQNAQYSVNSAKNPTGYLAEARTAAEQCLLFDPKSPDCHHVLGGVQLANARWLALQGSSPEASFRSSENYYDSAIQLSENQSYPEANFSQAHLYRWWAEWGAASGRNVDREVRRGLDSVSKVLAASPQMGEVIAIRGALELVQARSASSSAQRRALALHALEDLKKGIQQNANLAHAFAACLHDAESLR